MVIVVDVLQLRMLHVTDIVQILIHKRVLYQQQQQKQQQQQQQQKQLQKQQAQWELPQQLQ